MENTDIKLPGYVTTFHIGKEDGNWKAWTEFNGKRIEEKYCINHKDAEITRTMQVQKFWGNRLN